jgi:tyrosine-protein kinase Etk/Wzc
MENKNNVMSVNILDFIALVVKYKKFIFINSFIFVVCAVCIALVLPKYYTATAVIMPPDEDKAGLSQLMAGLPMKNLLGAGGLGDSKMEDVFISILQSRRNKLSLVNKFDLITVYKFNKMKKYFIEDVLKEVDENVFYSATELGTIAIGATDKDPKRAADMANFMVANLNAIYVELKTGKAKLFRQFLEERVAIAKNDLQSVELQFNEFQKNNNIIELEEQTKATIEAGATIEAQIVAANIELKITKEIYGSNSFKITTLEDKLKALKQERYKYSNNTTNDIFPAIKNVPDLSLKYYRLKRDLKVQELVFQFLTEQYEQAKFEEAKNTPFIQVLDNATPPEKRSKPKRTRLVLIAFFFSVLEGLFIVKCIDYYMLIKSNGSEEFLKIKKIVKSLNFKWL